MLGRTRARRTESQQDPDVPDPGEGFFYVSRRRHTLENAPGTYDPAICLTDVDEFRGPRTPASGDCPV